MKLSGELISSIFQNSQIFRTGGDEFSAIIQKDDYENQISLTQLFKDKITEIDKSQAKRWEKVSVAIGIAKYNSKTDSSVEDVIRRADKLMYKNKREIKSKNKNIMKGFRKIR